MNSSLVMSASALSPGNSHWPFENTSTYSQLGMICGLLGRRNDPHAVRRRMVCLYQRISVRMMRPRPRSCAAMS